MYFIGYLFTFFLQYNYPDIRYYRQGGGKKLVFFRGYFLSFSKFSSDGISLQVISTQYALIAAPTSKSGIGLVTIQF